jgi:hypothetical protein
MPAAEGLMVGIKVKRWSSSSSAARCVHTISVNLLLKSRYQYLEYQKKLDKALQLSFSSRTLRAHNIG